MEFAFEGSSGCLDLRSSWEASYFLWLFLVYFTMVFFMQSKPSSASCLVVICRSNGANTLLRTGHMALERAANCQGTASVDYIFDRALGISIQVLKETAQKVFWLITVKAP